MTISFLYLIIFLVIYMKYVLVTGGAQGLGKEIVKELSKNSYNVIIGYLTNEESAIELCSRLNSKYNVNNVVKKIDITCEEDVKSLFDEYNINILINNASLSNDNYIDNKSFDEFMKVVEVNLGGTYLMCKYAKSAKVIINISSKDGIDTYNPISLDYSSSKAGIINLSKNLSLYYKDKKIYCVCPGWINTESVSNMNPNYLKAEMERIGQKDLLNKEFVASKIVDLIDSNKESGSVVIIDE